MKHLLIFFMLTLPLLAQSEGESLSFLQKHHPAIHAKLQALKTTNRADYDSAIAEAEKAATDYARIEQAGDQPAATAFLKMYALDFEAVSLYDQFLTATDEIQRKEFKAKLRDVIAASFDQWQIVERARIKRLESELARVKAELETAVENRDTVITDDTEAVIEESRAYRANQPQTK